MSALFASPVVLGVVAAVLVVVIVLIIIVKRYRIARPDVAIIVTGRRGKQTINADGTKSTDLSGQKVVTGGGVFVFPFVQKSFELSLRSRKIQLKTTAQTTNGLTIEVQAVAMVKVGGTEEMIRAAAQRFLSQQEEIESYTQDIMSGSLRGIIGKLTVMSLVNDRDTLVQEVLSAAEESLTKQGLIVDTLQIQEITDTNGYLDNLGKPEAARVRQEAQIADTKAEQAAQEAKIAADRVILDKNRDLQIRQAEVKSETDKALAVAAAAQPIEAAVQQQRIIEQQGLAAQKETELKEQQLNATVRKVADADAYRTKTMAEAEASAAVATADAERRSRISRAEAVAEEGKAEAEAIKAKGEAEAAAIQARANALREQSGAVLAQQMIEVMPKMAEAFAGGYSNIDNFTVISADGANKIVGDTVGGMSSVFAAMKDATGIDVGGIIASNQQGRAIGEGLGSSVIPDAPVKRRAKQETATPAIEGSN